MSDMIATSPQVQQVQRSGKVAGRLGYIDNLRWSIIFLVVGVHAGLTYSHMGMWYYNEPDPPLKFPALITFMAFHGYTQGFFMGLLFFIAGYFTPGAYDRKGFGGFVRDRNLRLGVPTLIYVCLISPVIGRLILGRTVMFEWGPMWFAFALNIFSHLYALFRLVMPPPAQPMRPRPPSLAGVLALGLGISVLAFLIRTVQPIGTSVIGFQLCFFAQYVVLFPLGIVAYRQNWLARMSKRLGYGLVAAVVFLSPVAWYALWVYGGVFQRGFDFYAGGWHWQNAAYALWESLYGVAMGTGLLVLYREHFNGQGRFAKLMTDNSFGIYMFHPPIVIGLSLGMRHLAVGPLVKWAVLWSLSFLATLGIVELFLRRVPLLKRVL